MSNKNKWSKSLKLKHTVKLDKIFKSYWVRKFLNKIINVGKVYLSEKFLYFILSNFKKLKIFRKNTNFIQQLPPEVNFFKKGTLSKYDPKQEYFADINYRTPYGVLDDKYSLKMKTKILLFSEGEKVLSDFKLFSNFSFFNKAKRNRRLPKNKILKIKRYRYRKFPLSSYPYPDKGDRLYSLKKKPIGYLLRALYKMRWNLTTQFRRMGKFFVNIPTLITFPRSVNYGLKRIANSMMDATSFDSYPQRLYYEIIAILYRPKYSFSREARLSRLEIVEDNGPFTHYRWK